MSRSGKTTSVAQVWSVVRTNVTVASEPAAPLGNIIEVGEKPCSPALTRRSPGAPRSAPASDFLSQPPSDAPAVARHESDTTKATEKRIELLVSVAPSAVQTNHAAV